MSITIINGDALEELPKLAVCSVDSCVTDPPYELGFMRREWDNLGIAYSVPLWAEVLRVLKPGAYLLAFGGTRTYHRMACAIEDAGFEIRDQIGWAYGQGFPKSYNLPGGLGTALKPAWEPIVLARKPFSGTIAANLERHGTGMLNIDSSRVENGRWPANLAHDGGDEVLAAFPESAGQQGDLNGHSKDRLSQGIFGDMKAARNAVARKDSGSAARFFYCAKASKSEREAGLREAVTTDGRTKPIDNAYIRGKTERLNTHPTVKPTALMRWLCRLVTPRGGTVIDPFLGSGSSGRGAVLEGFNFIGIEREAEYVEIAKARIREAQGELFA